MGKGTASRAAFTHDVIDHVKVTRAQSFTSAPRDPTAGTRSILSQLYPQSTSQSASQFHTTATTAPAMPSSCKDIRAALASCLANSDCVLVERNKAGDCLRPPLSDTLPTQCQQLKRGYGECKKGMIDMRKRFRGNKPVAVSVEIEAGADRPSQQLYGGKPAFDAVRRTDGKEEEGGE
ncbi:MAG: hypothetical protein M1821_003007 [Bathelium mastoideum]|nr:MAG: hypothetical protein M1821_003007 [Bathelium mastoideum]KAI9681899.1 MAG: hypothetical protein M1822_006976 [Bathelium mastoideum]